jgi:two-component system, NtrC family, sensor histidine kinase HydH
MVKNEWMRRAAILALAGAIAACQHLPLFVGPQWSHFFPRLYALPVVLAALYDGWRGGLILTLVSAVAFLHQRFVGDDVSLTASPAAAYLELISFGGIALLTGIYTDRERCRRQKHQQIAEELSGVYEKLQTNFEGMKRAERLSAIGQLSAGLAHEIRNPLASIAGAASILRRNQPADAKASKCIDIIESECKRLNGLLTTFLNFARPRPPNLQAVSIDSMLDSVVTLAQHAVGQKRIDFRRRVGPDLPPLECDPEQMIQVLLNLVINATEASGEGAAVTLAAEQAGDAVRIQVIDEGSGVAPQDIDKLFDPFFTTKETGTGLGLPVAHQIVGQMGGSLTAHRNSGGGMTFSIAFPIRQPDTVL